MAVALVVAMVPQTAYKRGQVVAVQAVDKVQMATVSQRGNQHSHKDLRVDLQLMDQVMVAAVVVVQAQQEQV
jgi:hypothetical protein